MKHCYPLVLIGAVCVVVTLDAQPDSQWLAHDRDRPLPKAIDPGTFSTQNQPGRAPSDAVVLFNGGDLSDWCAMNGTETRWVVKEGAMECVPGSGYIRSRQSFGDCQLHVEWSAPTPADGRGQGRGNSGVFLGLGRYEIQVLDSYQNTTYPDGSAGSIYGQYPPQVNASKPPGEWQSYDIIWTGPQFDADGQLVSKAHATVFHNGILIHHNVELTGPTSWLERSPYSWHPEKLPIAFQDHGNPVRFRNVWVRELKPSGKPEYVLSDEMLDGYVGDYRRGRSERIRVRRGSDGTLILVLSNVEFRMYAHSQTKFFAKSTDVQFEFQTRDGVSGLVFSVGEGADWCPKAE